MGYRGCLEQEYTEDAYVSSARAALDANSIVIAIISGARRKLEDVLARTLRCAASPSVQLSFNEAQSLLLALVDELQLLGRDLAQN